MSESTSIPQPVVPPLLTAEDVAAMLKISKRTVWRMRATLQLPRPVKVGGAVRWRESDIAAWVAQGCSAIRDQQFAVESR